MARIPGVKFEKDAKGKKRYVRFDLKKHSETLSPLLKQLGAVNGKEDDYDEEFEKEFREGKTLDETFGNVIEYIKTLPWKK